MMVTTTTHQSLALMPRSFCWAMDIICIRLCTVLIMYVCMSASTHTHKLTHTRWNVRSASRYDVAYYYYAETIIGLRKY